MKILYGLMAGVLIGAGGLALVQHVQRGPTEWTSVDHATAPDWIRRGFERYRWSRVQISRDERGRITGHATAWGPTGTRSSEGDLVTLHDGQLAKDGTWLSYDDDANLMQIELYSAGTVAEALTIASGGQIEVFRYADGALRERLPYILKTTPASR